MKTTFKIIIPVVLALFSPTITRADTILFVSPTRVILNEEHKVEVMNLSNLSSIPRKYKISVENISMNEKGTTMLVDDFAYSAKKMIRFYPREITIQPGDHQAVRVMAKIGADVPDGEYHAHIKFADDGQVDPKLLVPPTGADSKSKAVVGIAYTAMLPIEISKGKIETKIGWSDPKISYNEQTKMYEAVMQLTRSGNGQGTAYIDAILQGAKGESAQLGNRRTMHIYRERDSREAKVEFKLPDGAGSGSKIKLRLLTGDVSKPDLIDEKLLTIP